MSVPYSVVQKTNLAYPKETVPNPVGVFAGSTSGIGEQLAYSFAKTTVDPTIYIIGRNEERGAAVRAEILKLNPSAKVTFLKQDLSLVSQAKELADTLKKNETKINLLAQSQGGLLYQDRNETKEGLDQAMSFNYYTRWALIDNVVDLVQRAADAGEPASVLTVLAAGNGEASTLNVADLELKTSYSFLTMLQTVPAYNSIAVQRFARAYPKISFIHTYPGLVQTNVGRALPFYLRIPNQIISAAIGRSAEVSGQYHLYASYTGKEFAKGGAHILGTNLQDVGQKGVKNGMYSVENQEILWKHTQEVYKRILGK